PRATSAPARFLGGRRVGMMRLRPRSQPLSAVVHAYRPLDTVPRLTARINCWNAVTRRRPPTALRSSMAPRQSTGQPERAIEGLVDRSVLLRHARHPRGLGAAEAAVELDHLRL